MVGVQKTVVGHHLDGLIFEDICRTNPNSIATTSLTHHSFGYIPRRTKLCENPSVIHRAIDL